MLTEEEKRLEALAKSAHDGPWFARRRFHANDWIVGSEGMPVLAELRGKETTARLLVEEDAEFIAAANPETVLRLLAEIRRLREHAGYTPDNEATP